MNVLMPDFQLTPDFQKYMTLVDCPYCHENAATEIAENPRVVSCNTCGLYRLYPRMNREGQISYLKQLNDELDLTNWGNPLDPQTFSMDEVRYLNRIQNFIPDGSQYWQG